MRLIFTVFAVSLSVEVDMPHKDLWHHMCKWCGWMCTNEEFKSLSATCDKYRREWPACPSCASNDFDLVFRFETAEAEMAKKAS